MKQWVVLCMLTMLATAGVPASGAEEETVFKDWALRSPEGADEWVLEQRVFIEGNDEAPLVRIAIQRLDAEINNEETEFLWGVLSVPLGVLLRPGLQLTIDEGDPLTIPLHHCRTGGCISLVPLNPGLRGDLEAGLKAQVAFHTLNGQRVGVPVSLMGIKAGIAALEKKLAE